MKVWKEKWILYSNLLVYWRWYNLVCVSDSQRPPQTSLIFYIVSRNIKLTTATGENNTYNTCGTVLLQTSKKCYYIDTHFNTNPL